MPRRPSRPARVTFYVMFGDFQAGAIVDNDGAYFHLYGRAMADSLSLGQVMRGNGPAELDNWDRVAGAVATEMAAALPVAADCGLRPWPGLAHAVAPGGAGNEPKAEAGAKRWSASV